MNTTPSANGSTATTASVTVSLPTGYYAVGYSEKHGKIITFRADRIVELEILESDAVPPPQDFSLPEFAREVFDMYDGQTQTVTLKCKNEMMKVILDRFGDSVVTKPLDFAHFQAEAEVSVSQTFFGWVFQFCGDIQIIAPHRVREQYRRMLEEAVRGSFGEER